MSYLTKCERDGDETRRILDGKLIINNQTKCHYKPNTDYDLTLDQRQQTGGPAPAISQSNQHQANQQSPNNNPNSNPNNDNSNINNPKQQQTYIVLYDYLAQRADELSLAAGQYVVLLGYQEPDWWQVRALDGTNRLGYFPSGYLAELYPEPGPHHPHEMAAPCHSEPGGTRDKLLRGQVSYISMSHIST